MSNDLQTNIPLSTLKRDQLKNSVRKEKRAEIFQNKRLKFLPEIISEPLNISLENSFESNLLTLKSDLLAILPSRNTKEITPILKSIRESVNKEIDHKNELVAKILKSTGLMDILLSLVSQEFFNDEVFMDEVFWIFINSSFYFDDSFWEMFKRNGFIEKCVGIVLDQSTSDLLLQNALWFIGNSIEDQNGMRDILLSINFLDSVCLRIKNLKMTTVIDHFTFIFYNVVKVRPLIKYELIEKYIPLCISYLTSVEDNVIHMNCLSALASICVDILSQNSQKLAEFILMFKKNKGCEAFTNIVEKSSIMESSNDTATNMLVKLTKILGTISFSNDDHELNYFLEMGTTDIIFILLANKSSLVRRNAAWILSNFMASNSTQISKIMLNVKLIERALYILHWDPSDEVRYNLLIAFNNAISSISDFSFENLCKKGLIKSYVDLMKLPESSTLLIETILDGLFSMLNEFAIYSASILNEIERFGGRQKLEELSNHEVEKIRETANSLLDHFSGDQIVQEK